LDCGSPSHHQMVVAFFHVLPKLVHCCLCNCAISLVLVEFFHWQQVEFREIALRLRLSNSTLKCSYGLAFASRFISEGQLFDYLPDSALSQVENVREFSGVFALDRWLCNCDGRQVVFCESERARGFRAHFIDFGFCFNAGEWNFPDTVLRGIYAHKVVYQNVGGWQSFEPWLSRIESFPLTTLWAIAGDVPPEWVERDTLFQLVERIDARRSRVRELIAAVRQSQRNPFGAWTEDKP